MKAPDETRDLWLELGCEELPPAVVRSAREALPAAARDALAAVRLPPRATFALTTPRRLVVVAQGVPARQEAEVRKVVGPAKDRALDASGAWTPAALGFLKKWKLTPADARLEATAKGEYLVAEVASPRLDAAAVMAEVVPAVFGRLALPRAMRWPQSTVPFARPVRWLGCLVGGEPAAASYAGVAAGSLSYGHRVLAPGPADAREAFDADGRLELARLKTFYRESLGVLVDIQDRRQAVLEQLPAAGLPADYFARADEHVRHTYELGLETVEMPSLVTGAFDERYLQLPAEVAEAALLGYLHLFPIFDGGRLRARFVAVHNGRRAAEGNVRAGLERVLAARLADASYFWEVDRKTPLDEMAAALSGVVFADGSGTLADKAGRLGALGERLGADLGLADGEMKDLARAAALCKADLVSQMVREKEFTHLQGTAGRLYAEAQGENAAVAAAVEEHYRPAGADDTLPATKLGKILALADRLDTLVALFAAGHKPTGARDPFGLRRAAVGVCRLLLEDEGGVFGGLALERLIAAAADIAKAPPGIEKEVEAFIYGRLAQIFLDRGFRDDMVEAVVYPAPEFELPLSYPRDMLKRLEALAAFHADRAAFGRLALAFKRPINILRQAREKKLTWGALDEGRLLEAEEKQLLAAYRDLGPKVRAALGKADYAATLSYLAALRPTVDVFFDTVMVMTDDAALRANRLALMQALADLFLSFADFTRLQGEEEYA